MHPLVVAFLLGEGESHEARLLILLEISWQEIAVARVWEELHGPASRLGLHGPLPHARKSFVFVQQWSRPVPSLLSSSTAAESHLKRLVLHRGGDVRRHGDLLRRFELQL